MGTIVSKNTVLEVMSAPSFFGENEHTFTAVLGGGDYLSHLPKVIGPHQLINLGNGVVRVCAQISASSAADRVREYTQRLRASSSEKPIFTQMHSQGKFFDLLPPSGPRDPSFIPTWISPPR